MSTETELNGQTYRTGRLNAFQQLHVSRKVAPLMPTLIPVYVTLAADSGAIGKPEVLAGLAGPFADALAQMPDEVVEYVAATCLSVVQRRQGGAWAPVWSAQGNCLMFDDIDLGALLPLVVRVISENLGPFLAGLLTAQDTGKQAPTT